MQMRERLQGAMKKALLEKEQKVLAVVRLILAAVKQFDVDNQRAANDEEILDIMVTMQKQRRDSIKQFTAANRADLVEIETAEMAVIDTFMPQAATEEEIEVAVQAAIKSSGAKSPKDMGQVMQILRNDLKGRADMSVVSNLVKSILGKLNS